jgi:hypothetical protein
VRIDGITGVKKHEEELLDGDDAVPERSLRRDGGQSVDD